LGTGNALFAYPAQSNFSGYRYPLEWISKVQSGCLDPAQQWYVLLDAAAFVSTTPLNLDVYNPDFVTLSFYKMFGFPTGLGN
jgi:molybdenum cofactor sulfurtransferase